MVSLRRLSHCAVILLSISIDRRKGDSLLFLVPVKKAILEW